jgi:CheY-like chemotaxis protein
VSIRILIVDDFKPWRLKIRSLIQRRPEWQVLSDASDGLEAVRKAAELKPDLILLDIGLSELNGIDAAREIFRVSPQTKILFVTQQTSADMKQAALATGAMGYVLKTDAARELLTAMETVLRGELFVSRRIEIPEPSAAPVPRFSQLLPSDGLYATPAQNLEIGRRHEARFYSENGFLLDDLTQFAGAALKAGNVAMVIAAESHRDSLLSRLQSYGLDMSVEIEQGRYIALDTGEALSTFMVNGKLDPDRFLKLFGGRIEIALEHAKGEPRRVAVYGECCGQLWAQGNTEAPVQMEKLGNQLMAMYDVDILCGYSLDNFEGKQSGGAFQTICAEHSAILLR